MCLSDFASATVENLSRNAAANCEGRGLASLVACRRGPGGAEEGGARSRGCVVRVARVDWDDDSTWPAAPVPDDASCRGLFDVVIAADVLYRRSYARKVATVVRGVLKPGGLFVSVSPVAREGFTLLRRLLSEDEGGSAPVDAELPTTWRSDNPLRSPEAASLLSSALPPPGSVVDPSPEATLVPDAAARGLFPELAMPGYELVCTLFTLPASAPESRQ